MQAYVYSQNKMFGNPFLWKNNKEFWDRLTPIQKWIVHAGTFKPEDM